MKEKIKKIYLIGAVIFLIVIIIGIFYWRYQKYQEKMIKFDACMSRCVSYLETGVTGKTGCGDECREKYGVTWEEYSEWMEKNKK